MTGVSDTGRHPSTSLRTLATRAKQNRRNPAHLQAHAPGRRGPARDDARSRSRPPPFLGKLLSVTFPLPLVIGLALAAASCEVPRAESLDPDLISVSSKVTMRTDTVGEGEHTANASFVLVEAENRGPQAATVSLSGTFRDEHGAELGVLRAESLWMPPGGRRLFALVDRDRQPRPTARGAQIVVSGVRAAARPPIMRIEGESSRDDFGKILVSGTLVNDADRAGRAMVFGAFFDGKDKPMTRPFVVVPIAAKSTLPVHLVGPPGSTRGALYLGDLVY